RLAWCFFFSSRRRHTRLVSDWSSDVCSSDLAAAGSAVLLLGRLELVVDLERRLRDQVEAAEDEDQVAPGELVGEHLADHLDLDRSEERRVGKECRCRRGTYH